MAVEYSVADQPPAGDVPESPSSFTYDAFISYSHEDIPVAAAVQKGLSHIGRRMGQRHALKVFRDATDLSADPNLWGRVSEAMDRARYLIVVLSPHAAASPWVDREISYWIDRRGIQNIRLVLAAGRLDFDHAAGCFAAEGSDAAPPALTTSGVLPTEPLYVDVTAGSPWDLGDPVFRDKVTDLAAPIHGIPKSELTGDDLREQRKFRRVRRAAVAGLALLTILAVALALFAFGQQKTALRQRDQAESRRLASESQAVLDRTQPGGDVRAFQLALAARRLGHPPDDSPIVNALRAEPALLKVIGTPKPSVALSPDGSRIASGVDSTVRFWDAVTGMPIGEPLTGHTGRVTTVVYSSDGTRIASGADDNTVQLWDTATGAPLGKPLTGHTAAVTSVAFSPDGTRIASGSNDEAVRLWDVATGRQVGVPMRDHDDALMIWDATTGRQFEVPTTARTGAVLTVAFSPDGTRLASGYLQGSVRIWDAATGLPVGDALHARTDAPFDIITGVAFSPDGTRLACGNLDGTVRFWEVSTGRLTAEPLKTNSGVTSLSYSANGARIASGEENGSIQMWDAATRRPVGEPMMGHAGGVNRVALNRDGTRIVSSSEDGTVRIWDTSTRLVGRPPSGNRPHTGVSSVAYSPDGTHLASGGSDGIVRIWDTDELRVRESLTGHAGGVNSVAYSRDGTRLASGSEDGTVRIWDPRTGEPLGQQLTGHTGGVRTVAFSPDGTRLAFDSDDNTVRIWDITTGSPVGEPLIGHTDPVISVAFSPDGTRLASGSEDNSVRIWDVASAKAVGDPLTGHGGWVRTVAFSPDGTRLASGSDDDKVRIWDAHTGKPVGEPLIGHTEEVHSVAFSHDGARLASVGGDGRVRLWDMATGKPLGDPLSVHQNGVATSPSWWQQAFGRPDWMTSVAFSPDSARIATGGTDDTVRLWPAYPDPTQALCARLTANMSQKQWDDWVSSDIGYQELCPGLPVAAD